MTKPLLFSGTLLLSTMNFYQGLLGWVPVDNGLADFLFYSTIKACNSLSILFSFALCSRYLGSCHIYCVFHEFFPWLLLESWTTLSLVSFLEFLDELIFIPVTASSMSLPSLIFRSNEMFFSSHALNTGQFVLLLDNPGGEPSLKGMSPIFNSTDKWLPLTSEHVEILNRSPSVHGEQRIISGSFWDL